MKKILLACTLIVLLFACSSDSDEDTGVKKLPVTVDYLVSVQRWSDSSTSYSFFRIGSELTGAKNVGSSSVQQYTYTVNAPSVTLTYSDGKTESLTVYRLDANSGVQQLEINGKTYIGIAGGVDL